jgi:hypothetical protein
VISFDYKDKSFGSFKIRAELQAGPEWGHIEYIAGNVVTILKRDQRGL